MPAQYPDENGFWNDPVTRDVAADYVQAGASPDDGRFKWFARTAYDVGRGMIAVESWAKHRNEMRGALGQLPIDRPSFTSQPTPGPVPYPDENTWWNDPVTRDVLADYAEARVAPDDGRFKWFSRTAFDIAGGMTAEASWRKHRDEMRIALGLSALTPPLSAPRMTGSIRMESRPQGKQVYRDDKGPRLPVTCHHGDAVCHWTRGRKAEIRTIDDEIAAAGYDAKRVWPELPANPFWSERSGEDLRTAPRMTRNYYPLYEEMLDEMFNKRGLRLQHSIGGLDGELESRNARREHIEQIAEIHKRVGYEAIACFEVNEPQGIGARTPSEVWDFMDIYRRLTGGKVLTFDGSPYDYETSETLAARGLAGADVFYDKWARFDQLAGRAAMMSSAISQRVYDGESKQAIDAWSARANGWQHHSYRGGDDAAKLRHPKNIAYEMGLAKFLGLLSEPPGPDDPVSVGRLDHPEAVAALCAVGATSRGWPTYFCGRPGIWSRFKDGRWAKFAGVAGFASAAKLVHRLEAHAPELHTGKHLHVGDGQQGRIWDLPDNEEDIRIDQTVGDGWAVGALYAASPRNPRVRQLVGERTTVVHPVTMGETMMGDRVGFERARLLLASW